VTCPERKLVRRETFKRQVRGGTRKKIIEKETKADVVSKHLSKSLEGDCKV